MSRIHTHSGRNKETTLIHNYIPCQMNTDVKNQNVR